MAKVERYRSFEEMDKAVEKRQNLKADYTTSGQKAFREFGEMLRRGIKPSKKKK